MYDLWYFLIELGRIIDEMLNRDWLDRLLNDSYANYVVQTALDFADPMQRSQVYHLPHPHRIACRDDCTVAG